MWIKTQDGKQLINTDAAVCIYQAADESAGLKGLCCIMADEILLGEYRTEEEAERVLNDIHKAIHIKVSVYEIP